jgi:hypothetical protein
MWLKFYNDFCNLPVKASTSLLTHEEADKLNQCGAHTAIILLLLSWKVSQKIKTWIWVIYPFISSSTTHNYQRFLFFCEVFDHCVDCGNDCFPVGIRLRQISYKCYLADMSFSEHLFLWLTPIRRVLSLFNAQILDFQTCTGFWILSLLVGDVHSCRLKREPKQFEV